MAGEGVRPAVGLPDPQLSAGEVVLRPWHDAGAVFAVFAAFSDPDVLRWSWGSAEPYSEQAAARFLREQDAARRAGEELQLAVGDRAGHLLGGVSLYDLDPGRATASVGYWLVAAARGRGVATTAVRLLAAHAFTALAVERLELTCAPDNAASRAVAARAGFTYEGRLRAHLPFRGGRRDSLLHSLLPGDPARPHG